MATRKPRRFGSGGETDKEEGLKASKDEKVGFFERMRMGNIDQEGSEAYNRFGAGRGKAERDEKNEAAAMKAVDLSRASAAKKEDEEEPKPSKAMRDRAEEQGKKQDSGDASVAEMYQGARKESVKSQSSTPAKVLTKPSSKPEFKTPAKNEVKAPAKDAATPSKKYTSDYSNESRSTPTAKRDTSNYSNESRGREMSKKQQLEREIESIKPTAEQTQKGLEAASSMMGGAGLKALHNAAKKLAGTGAKKAAESGGSRAVSTAVDDGVTFLGRSGGRQVGGFPEVGRSGARQLSDNATRQLPAPPKQLSGPSKGELVAKNRAAREAKRRAEMGQDNASRYNLDPKSSDYADRAKSIRDNLGGDDFTLGMKRGGKVKSSPSKPAAKGWGMARGARTAKMR